MRRQKRDRLAERAAQERTAHYLLVISLLEVTPEGNLVTARGVEIPTEGDWELDVLETLVEIESL